MVPSVVSVTAVCCCCCCCCNLYLYTAVVWGGDQGAVHYAFYVSTKSGWGWSVRRENLGVGLWPTGRLTNVGRGAYVTTLLLSTETDGCIVQHIHWVRRDGARRRCMSGLSHRYMRVRGLVPTAGGFGLQARRPGFGLVGPRCWVPRVW